MGTYTYSEERRRDPEILNKAERIHKAQQAMMIKAAKTLQELADEMRILSGVRESHSIYDRCYDAVWRANSAVNSDAFFMKNIGGETYIGNMAASAVGEYIQSIDFEERFQGKA